MKNIYIVTSKNNFFGRARYGWQSLDLKKMYYLFSKIGNVTIINIDELLLKDFTMDDILLVGGDPVILQSKYHIDVLEFLKKRFNVRIFPKIELLKAHENKGYQELLKKQLNINSLNSLYLNSIETLDKLNIKYPLVYKTITGAGGSKVQLINDLLELKKTIKKSDKIIVSDLIKLIIKKFSLSRSDFMEYKKSKRNVEPFILQPFVPNLENDFRVLCFGNRYYSSKRLNRKNDFRASGSGKLIYEKQPLSLIKFARKIQLKLEAQVLSLDICFDGNDYHLIEFQACHFGNQTLNNSVGYYQYGQDWEYKNESSKLTEVFCQAYINSINE